MAKGRDTLERAVAFLQKRDGTDKLLKILRYSVKLALAASPIAGSLSSETKARMKSFESSVGTSRKALRVGKFLQDLDELRRAPSFGSFEGLLELVAAGGEGVYYFVEQFIWLVKAGAMDKRHGPRLQTVSAAFELFGYTGSVTLKAFQVAHMMKREKELLESLERQGRAAPSAGDSLDLRGGGCRQEADMSRGCEEEEEGVRQQLLCDISTLRFKQLLKLLSLLQDLSDSLLALADLVEESKQPVFLRSPAFLAGAGLLSALISAHKNWVAVS